mgnify:CR=1 FL=1
MAWKWRVKMSLSDLKMAWRWRWNREWERVSWGSRKSQWVEGGGRKMRQWVRWWRRRKEGERQWVLRVNERRWGRGGGRVTRVNRRVFEISIVRCIINLLSYIIYTIYVLLKNIILYINIINQIRNHISDFEFLFRIPNSKSVIPISKIIFSNSTRFWSIRNRNYRIAFQITEIPNSKFRIQFEIGR